MPLTAGTRLGPYEIVSPLGAGGMGEVWKARDTRLGRDVAIKVLPDRVAQDSAALSRFEREARAVAALSHPNILAIHDFGKQDGVAYAVTELLEGKTLRERLDSGALPTRRAIEYGVQIARGLAAAHEKGIVHRDLKPDNVFLTRDDRIKILDFGLAKPFVATGEERDDTRSPTAPAYTEPGTVMGTVGYMSPEQVKGLTVDQRSDIFSFGAVLYEMVTGRRAFQRDTPVETMSAILKEEPPEVSSQAESTISPGLARIVGRCLEKDPANRFQTARDLAFALEEQASALSALPGAARHRSVTGGQSRLRHARLVLLAAAAAAAVVAGVILVSRRGVATGAGEAIRSLAVLPLANLSGDPSQDFFADGMTEELIADLAQIGSLRVISRTSVMRYKGTRRPLPEIARELGVEGIVEGSVLRAGNRVRITAQLIHAPTDRHLWAHSYDRDLRDVLSLQDEVARDIAGRVRARISSEEKARLTRDRPVNPEAYEHYLRGLTFWSQWTPEDTLRGLEEFRRALEIDPKYAPAYSWLSASYARLADMSVVAPADGFSKSLEASRKALALDPSLPEAHLSLGMTLLWYEWDFPRAEEEIRRSLELNPGYVTGHRAYSAFLSVTGRTEEALSESAIARRLDPVSPLTLFTRALQLYYSRRWGESETQLHSLLELSPRFPVAYALLGRIHAAQGKYEPAVAELDRAVSDSRQPDFVAWFGCFLGRAGRTDDARRQLAELESRGRSGWVSSVHKATIALGLGEIERVFSWLEDALSRRDNQLIWAYADPLWDPLRSDPRFLRIYEKVGLPRKAK